MSHGRRIVVAGIHTGVGKTVVATILTEVLEGYYWKPVQCGMPRDRDWVEARLSLANRCYPEGVCLAAPCSPHLAARMEGICIEVRSLTPPFCSGDLIIEGTGGLLSPLSETYRWVDGAVLWEAHWILVHRHYLGSLNHFFLTIEAMRHRKLPLLGVIFNGEGDAHTEDMLLNQAGTGCLGRLSWQKQLTQTRIREIAKGWKEALQAVL